jgi:hypothetical protein
MDIGSYILGGVVVWAVGMVSYMVIRAERSSQHTLDALLVLTDKQAAVTAAGMSRARQAPKPGPVDEAARKRAKSRADTDRIIEEIEATGVITLDQEHILGENGAL